VQSSPLLVQRLELYESNLLVELRSRQVLSDSDYQRLNTETVNSRRNLLLINVLLRGSKQAWNRFVEALGETNRKDLQELCRGSILKQLPIVDCEWIDLTSDHVMRCFYSG
jgi:Caspase recruitment domain